VSSSAFEADSPLRVGAIKRPHGLRGEIAIEPLGDFPQSLAPGSRLTARVSGVERELSVASARPHGTHVLVRFEGLDSIETVEGLAGGDLYVERSELPLPSPDFIFDDEVRRFRCVSLSGESLGQAVAFERFGQNCCLRIESEGKAVLVPFVRPIVREVSRDRSVIVLDPPEGLFEL
jgi:16S rRNA processing protein RimM